VLGQDAELVSRSSDIERVPVPAVSQARAVPGDAPGGFTHRQILTVLAGLMMGMFLAALDQTIVSSAIRTIGDDLHGLSVQAWVTTAYLITSTISTPLYGKLSDNYGRKPFYLFAISVFIIGSAASAFATSMYMLAAFRAFQGLGAGGLMSLALAIIGDIVAPRERARYQGYILAVFGLASVLGPVIGGFFAGTSSILAISGWRWVFLVNVPIGLAALVVVWHTLNVPHSRRPHRIDVAGAVALIVCLVPLLVIAEQGRDWGWGSSRALACYAVGAIGLIAFVAAERRIGDDALLPLRLFQNGVFRLTSTIGLVVGMAMFGGIAMLPLYLQIVKGVSPTGSGLRMLPLMGGLIVASILSGRLIARTGRYKIFPLVGGAAMIAGMVLLFFLHADTAYWYTAVGAGLFGVGLGGVLQPITLATQNAVPPRDIGVASASSQFFRGLGGTLGTAVFLSILFSTAGSNIHREFVKAAATPSFRAVLADPQVQSAAGNRKILELIHGGGSVNGASLNDTAFLQHADRRLAEPFFRGFSSSIDLVFLIAGCALVVAFALLLFLREVPLRTMSGIEAARAEREGPPTD
jgi:EmrB/QacA subfamily drug resistance transporter